MKRALGATCALALLPALVALGCDDTGDRRQAAVYQVQGANPDAADKGATTLETLIQKNPHDRISLYVLAGHYEKRGRLAEAKVLYQRVIVGTPGSEEAVYSREGLARIVAATDKNPRGVVSAVALAPTAIVSGKGLQGLFIGAPNASAIAMLGPCELQSSAPSASVCHYFSRGIELAFAAGSVSRVSLMREGREHAPPLSERHEYRGFIGETPDGLKVGMHSSDVRAKVGAPAGSRVPLSPHVGKDHALPLELADYPKKGMTLELDHTQQGLVVGAIHIPTIDGRPMPSAVSGGKP